MQIPPSSLPVLDCISLSCLPSGAHDRAGLDVPVRMRGVLPAMLRRTAEPGITVLASHVQQAAILESWLERFPWQILLSVQIEAKIPVGGT